jgi:hypothetical protein
MARPSALPREKSRPARRTRARRTAASRPRRAAVSTDAERVRNLVALEAAGLMRRLAQRSEEMISLFSRLREREPLLAPLRSPLTTMSFEHLALLEPRQQSALGHFVDELEALRWYFQYTTDMPSSAQLRLRQHRRSLEAAYQRLAEEIGPAQAPAAAGEPR